MTISVVINTRNEAKNITRCLRSIGGYVDEIVVVDMYSTDDTVKLARQFTDRIFKHEYTGYVEPARNFAISKAKSDWILLLDADEVLPDVLGVKLRKLAQNPDITYYRIPRKNLIFGKWVSHSGWWPDFQIRLFRKDSVTWNDEIHSIPVTEGKGADLPQDDKEALIHYHYTDVEQYLERLNRYTTQEALQLVKDKRVFNWQDLIIKPFNEFITRFFAWEGYKDGLAGLVLSLLQAMSFLIVEIKFWEKSGYPETSDKLTEKTTEIINKKQQDLIYWRWHTEANKNNSLNKLIYKTRSKLRI